MRNEKRTKGKPAGQRNLTQGSIAGGLAGFSLPYLLSCFLQTFYGLADLFFVGQFNGADTITAVSVGSQIVHMLTVVIVGFAMGTTVSIGRAVGAGERKQSARVVGNTVILFAVTAAGLTAVLTAALGGIVAAVSTPAEAVEQTKDYLRICFAGIPFITAYNVISSIFRGLGDSKTPMYFVAAAGVVNVILDYVLVGPLGLGAEGAAFATVFAQACSVALALAAMRRMGSPRRRETAGEDAASARNATPGYGSEPASGGMFTGISLHRSDFLPDGRTLSGLLRVGLPIAAQDGFIQISFLVITAIANGRGVDIAAAVGIVEKIISFFFLVPSAMLSSVSAMAAQNAGAGKHGRARRVLWYGIGICVGFGLFAALLCQFGSEQILKLFAGGEPEVVRLGAQYLRAYIFDCAAAGIHFCFSGYFCAYGRAFYSFLHNVLSVVLIRIPGAYFASLYFPKTLYPMGLAAPAGSLFSAAVCAVFYILLKKTLADAPAENG